MMARTCLRVWFNLVLLISLVAWPAAAQAQEPAAPAKPPIPAQPDRSVDPAQVTAGFDLTLYPDTRLGLTYEGGSQFYGIDSSDSGIFLWLEGVNYGPGTEAGSDVTDWTPVAHSRAGTGSASDPITATAVVAAGTTGVQVITNVRYITGTRSIDLTTSVVNHDSVPHAVSIFHAGDIYLEFPHNEADFGYGTRRTETSGIGATTSTGDWAFLFEPVDPPKADAWQEAVFEDLWDAVGRLTPGSGLNNTFVTEYHDAAAALQWNRTVPAGGTVTVRHRLRLDKVTLRRLDPQIDAPNAANFADATHLTRRDFVEHFGGGGTCPASGECLLIPPAEEWYQAYFANAGEGGHCYGLSLAATYFFRSLWSAPTFTPGAPTAFALVRPNASLDREVALENTLQYDLRIARQVEERLYGTPSSVTPARPALTPNQILAEIQARLKINNLDPIVLLLRGRTPDTPRSSRLFLAAHAVVPFDSAEQGDGRVRIYVYDPNFPGNRDRYVLFSPMANTWVYPMGSGTRPIEGVTGTDVWAGNATLRSLSYTTMSAHTANRPRLPYRREAPSVKPPLAIGASSSGGLDLLIRNGAGQRLGYDAATILDEIDGGIPVIPANLLQSPGTPLYYLPPQDASIELTPAAGAPVTGTLLVMGDLFGLRVAPLNVAAGQTRYFKLSDDGVTVRMGQAALPPDAQGAGTALPAVAGTAAPAVAAADVVSVTYSFQEGTAPLAGRSVELGNLLDGGSSSLELSWNGIEEYVRISNRGPDAQVYDLRIDAVTGLELWQFRHWKIKLEAGRTHWIYYKPRPDNTIQVIVLDEDGTLESVITLEDGESGGSVEDVAGGVYLPIIAGR